MRDNGITSYSELARRLGVTHHVLNRIKTMTCRKDYIGLVKVAEFFKVTTDYVMSDSMRFVGKKFQGILNKEEKAMDSTEIVSLLEARNETYCIEENIERDVDTESFLDDIKKVLTAREFDVICMRFGLDGYDAHCLDEVGKKHGVTKERVRQIEIKGQEKIRNIRNIRKFRGIVK